MSRLASVLVWGGKTHSECQTNMMKFVKELDSRGLYFNCDFDDLLVRTSNAVVEYCYLDRHIWGHRPDQYFVDEGVVLSPEREQYLNASRKQTEQKYDGKLIDYILTGETVR